MRTALTPEASSALLSLIEACTDGELGFHAAAANMVDPLLRQLCESYAAQRAGFRRELKGELVRLGLASIAGDAVDRGRDAAPFAATPDESAALAELARREAHAEATYREALGRNIPASVAEIVARQHLQVLDALKHLGQLEHEVAGHF